MTETTFLTILAFLLGGFAIYFVVRFVLPFWSMRGRLAAADEYLAGLHEAAVSAKTTVTDLSAIDKRFEDDEVLSHLWGEFRDTLHAETSETDFDDAGQPRVRFRQTVPAELYFSGRSLIDVPLRTDFFRHLPGILTGIGIVGTFYGLISGLKDFDIAGNPDRVNANVESLIESVRDAFWVSLAAIALAMIVTVAEKLIVASLHGRVQRLQQTLDGMFDAGAGEDYLSSIARGSEQTAAHLGQLKEGMINELRPLFEELADKQSSSSLAAAELIGNSVNEVLQSPLERMTTAMEKSLDDQQVVVHELMDKSLAVFAERLEELVGEKLTGSAEHIEAAASQMRAAMQEAPAQLEAAVGRVRSVLEDVAKSAEPMAANAERMTVAADKLATTVEQASETLDYAMDRFRGLGAEMGNAIGSANEVSASLAAGAEKAESAAQAMTSVTTQFEAAATRLAAVIESLAEVADQRDEDAAAHRELAGAVERAASQLSAAQTDVDAFLAGLADALSETHATFSREINGTLSRTHEEFHRNLATSTEQLAGTVSSFGDFLETDFRESVEQLQAELARLGSGTDGSKA